MRKWPLMKLRKPNRTWQHGARPYDIPIRTAMEEVDEKIQSIAESKIAKKNQLMFGQ